MAMNGPTQASKSLEPAVKAVAERAARQVARVADEIADTALAARDAFSIQKTLAMLRARSKVTFAKSVIAELQCRLEGEPCAKQELPLP